MVWKDTGEITVPTTRLPPDQISHSVNDCFDFEQSSDVSPFRIGDNIAFWSNSIRASDFVIDTIRERYKIPFFDLPSGFRFLCTCDISRVKLGFRGELKTVITSAKVLVPYYPERDSLVIYDWKEKPSQQSS